MDKDPKWLQIAYGELGEAEVPGPGDNPRVVAYQQATTLGYPDNANDETPWCSSFINWCMKQAGLARTKSAWARSWLGWGRKVLLQEARRGDVVIFSRGGNAGHVAFFLKQEAGYIWVLGGNQGNAVSEARFPRGRFLGVRRPKEAAA